jgi:hypothetical protein
MAGLVRAVFTEESVLPASFRAGFFEIATRSREPRSPLQDAACFLANNRQRFWRVLERLLLAGEGDRSKELLQTYAQFHIARRSYPSKTGGRLLRLITALPPAVRRLKIAFPILDVGICVELTKFAQRRDYQDVPALFDAALGKHLPKVPEERSDELGKEAESPEWQSSVFDVVVSSISEGALAQRLSIPIDSARASYRLDSSTVGSYDEFVDILTAFYVHLRRYIQPDVIDPPGRVQARSKAEGLLERTFGNRGGARAAFIQARDGIDGGMRSVLDAVSEQVKRDEQAEYVGMVLKDATDGLDAEQRTAFVREAMRRLRPFLPSEVSNEPPERFARGYEAIARAYVQWLDHVNRIWTTL